MPQKPLTSIEVLKQVKDLARAGKVEWRHHTREQMALRHIDSGLIFKCLISGTFDKQPEEGYQDGHLEYVFTMRAGIDGWQIRVVAALDPNIEVFVITVLPRKK